MIYKGLINMIGLLFLYHLYHWSSGDPKPSNENIKVTERLIKAGYILGVQVLDYIIIGRPNYTSSKEKGYV